MSWYKTLRKKNCVDCGIEFETFRPGQKRCAPCGKKADRAAQAKFCAKKRAETEKKKAELAKIPESDRPKDPMDLIRERFVAGKRS